MNARRLLFVDDEPAIRLTLSAILQQQGFEVATAASVPEALDYINKRPFDVLLADLNIGQPGDGFTVISAMRRTQPEAVTLILTGFPDFETALQALRGQVDDYLTKPVDIKELIATIKQKIEHPGRQAPLQTKRVSTVFRENADKIIEQWFEAALRDRELSRISLSRHQRIDHLPTILAELADGADSRRFEAGEETREAAHRHGRQRREQGYKARLLVIEARILHNVISRTLHEHLLSLDVSTLMSDVMQIGERLNEELEESVRGFEEEPLDRTA